MVQATNYNCCTISVYFNGSELPFLKKIKIVILHAGSIQILLEKNVFPYTWSILLIKRTSLLSDVFKYENIFKRLYIRTIAFEGNKKWQKSNPSLSLIYNMKSYII